jgi:hypothetical protein
VATNLESTLLDALRSTQEVPPSQGDDLVKALKEISNKLDDLKQAVFVSNEIQLELLEGAMKGARSEFGAQARPSRNMPPSSFRRWS